MKRRSSTRKLTKPPALCPGDTIGIVAPGSNISHDLLLSGCESLRQMGYQPLYHPSILEQDLYFAGSAVRRARELEAMFECQDVRAILCARGGYGCNYLLPLLDLRKIRRHPKILMGYSDVTSLLTWITDSTGLVTFHGPMVTKDFALPNGIHRSSWQAAVNAAATWELRSADLDGFRPLLTGRAQGRLYGGCLSMLAASLGTPYEIETPTGILFVEDVNAKPFQIDRMLMQLKLAGKLRRLRGIVFGEMLDCVQHPSQPYTLEEVVLRVVADLGIPVAFGLRSGHVSRDNITLPLGVKATLEVGKHVRLAIDESASA